MLLLFKDYNIQLNQYLFNYGILKYLLTLINLLITLIYIYLIFLFPLTNYKNKVNYDY